MEELQEYKIKVADLAADYLANNTLINMSSEANSGGMIRNKRKRRRLSRVVDQLAVQAGGLSLVNHNNNNTDTKPQLMAPKREATSPGVCPCATCALGITTGMHNHHHDRFFPASPVSPLTPSSLPPEEINNCFNLPEVFRGRSHSDSDLPGWNKQPEFLTPSEVYRNFNPNVGDVNNFQDVPLDLSVKSTIKKDRDDIHVKFENSFQPISLAYSPDSMDRRGDLASAAERFGMSVSPVVEEMPPGADVAFACTECGQLFSVRDRLAKHVASCHKGRRTVKPGARAYICGVCSRPFARSDMLTRHSRLHTGAKPYECRTCGQVFSRSDHLSTHQRTHTGEKPYRCPQCLYAACRRDMITRHMRTHARDPLQLHREPNIIEKERAKKAVE